MQLTEKMDAGPIVAQARIEIDEDTGDGGWPPKGSEFEKFLATEGGNLLAETLEPWIAGDVPAEPQNEAAATYTKNFLQKMRSSTQVATRERSCLKSAHSTKVLVRTFS